ncbi:MAG: hypothetical protein EON58_03375 [Alphaproteobacteria bacterium]|nr:MAG: hypothetical protein EON58_03375 [Alphaproteobacteria bacterium]
MLQDLLIERQMKSDEAHTIFALSYEGLSAVTADGKPAQFAIVDEVGKVIASRKHIADAAFHVTRAYRMFLMGKGYLSRPHKG